MLTDLATAARKSGLKIVEVNGWKTRGRPGSFKPIRGIIVHHTASSTSAKDSAVTNLLVKGRSDLPGPLSQLGLGRDGTVYVVAAGRSNHAGRTKRVGPFVAGDGNTQSIGIEAYNSGYEGWSKKQLEAYYKLCAALCDHYRLPRSAVFGHGETSETGKWDPGHNGRMIDMVAFRKKVASVKFGETTQFYVAAQYPSANKPNHGKKGPHVLWLKQRLRAHGYGGFIIKSKVYGGGVKAAVRKFQEDQGWRGAGADGYPGPKTLEILGAGPRPSKPVLFKMGHASLQFSDSLKQREADAAKIFKRAASAQLDWVTGTEAFEKSTAQALKREAKARGYRFYRHASQDSWVAVRKAIIKGGWRTYYDRVIRGKAKKHSAKGGFGVSFNSIYGFRVGVLAGHLLTAGRPEAKDPARRVNVDTNKKIMASYAKIARKLKREGAVVFYGGDQNIPSTSKPFYGYNFHVNWKELGKHPRTHSAGSIDMMAYFGDPRVQWVGGRVFNDNSIMSLHSDHFYLESTARVM